MTDPDDADRTLRHLLAYPADPRPDPAFAQRVVALAATDLKLRHSRHRLLRQIAVETAGLAAVLTAFALLGRIGPAAGFGDALPAHSPAMAGVVILALWALILPGSARQGRLAT